jgi:hypothetical protein
MLPFEKGGASMVRRLYMAESSRKPGRTFRPQRPHRFLTVAAPSGVDWRGWIALAWAMVWGWAYVLVALQARAPQIVCWIRTIARRVAAGG